MSIKRHEQAARNMIDDFSQIFTFGSESAVSPELFAAARDRQIKRFEHMDLEHDGVRELLRLCVVRDVLGSVPAKGSRERLDAHLGAEAEQDSHVSHPTMESFEASDLKLASLPDIFIRIREVLGNPRASVAHVAEVISLDPSLSAKLLKLVNSPFYGYSAKVDTLNRAVTILGSRQLMMLALGVAVITMFKDIPPGLVDMRSFWRHSIGCGIICKLLSVKASVPGERAFVSGLLHDIGRLLLYKDHPRSARMIIRAAQSQETSLTCAETSVLGFTHAAIGGSLLKSWRFPASIEGAVRFHHAPENALEPREPALVHVSDVVTHALSIGSSGSTTIPALSPAAWTLLGLSPKDLADLVIQVDRHVDDMTRGFTGA